MEKEYRLTSIEAAVYLDITPETLANWRYLNRSPVYYKIGGKIIYTKADLDAWIRKFKHD